MCVINQFQYFGYLFFRQICCIKYVANGLNILRIARAKSTGGGCGNFSNSKLSTTYMYEKSDSTQFEEIPPKFYEYGRANASRVTNTNDYYRAPF